MSSGNATEVSVLLVAIVQPDDASKLVDALVRLGFPVTRLDAFGDWLREGSAVLLVATSEERQADVQQAVSEICRTRTAYVPGMLVGDPVSRISMPMLVEVGGAVVFALPVERFVRLSDRRRAEATRGPAGARGSRPQTSG